MGLQKSINNVLLFDVDKKPYSFEKYGIHEFPTGNNLVYSFSRCMPSIWGESFDHLYIGETDIFPNRLSGHEKKNKALQLGATHLLVHRIYARLGEVQNLTRFDIEKRLIEEYQPILNIEHNPRYKSVG